MHQDPANSVVTEPPTLVTPAVHTLGEADRMRVAALVGELRGVLQNQDRPVGSFVATAGSRKMTIEDLAFFNSRVREETIGGFGVAPILAGKRNAATHPLAQSAEQIAKPPPEPSVLESCNIDFPPRPMARIRCLLAVLCRHFAPQSKNQVLDTESQPILSIQESSAKDLHTSQKLVGNCKPAAAALLAG